MRRVLRVVVGYRDDLNLPSRWWHRLFFVLTALSLASIFILSVSVLHQRPTAVRSNVIILADLQSYTSAHPTERNTFVSFAALTGFDGVIKDADDTIEDRWFVLYENNVLCNADFRNIVPEMTAWFKTHTFDGGNVTEDSVRKALGDKDTGFCLFDKPTDWPAMSQIIKYRFPKRLLLKAWAQAVLYATALAFGTYVFLGNLYYRGLIYIIFGKRQPQTPASV
jgi:hypothetical protein